MEFIFDTQLPRKETHVEHFDGKKSLANENQERKYTAHMKHTVRVPRWNTRKCAFKRNKSRTTTQKMKNVPALRAQIVCECIVLCIRVVCFMWIILPFSLACNISFHFVFSRCVCVCARCTFDGDFFLLLTHMQTSSQQMQRANEIVEFHLDRVGTQRSWTTFVRATKHTALAKQIIFTVIMLTRSIYKI